MNLFYAYRFIQEEILRVLRETYVESSRQKSYLDQLMSAVVERAPWLLDDIETEFEAVTSLPSHNEQWC